MSDVVPRGGFMITRPLPLHAYSKASDIAPLRVLHFVFGQSDLPEGLRRPAQAQSTVDAC